MRKAKVHHHVRPAAACGFSKAVLDVNNPDPSNHPKLVSPAALYLVSENAPNGRIIQAAGGKFASDMVFANKGIDLGSGSTWEDVSDNVEEILDINAANLKTTFWVD